jgi:hypothetical protein
LDHAITGLVIKDALNNFAALSHHHLAAKYLNLTMPSRLRLQEDFTPISVGTIRPNFVSSQPPQKKQKMSLTQTYYVAASARAKLGKEACKPDHNLRLLVGHANMLDSLMLEIQSAREQEELWFEKTVQKAQKSEEPKHIQWLDTIVQEEDEEEDSDDAASEASDSDSDFDEEEFEMLPLKRLRSPPVTVTSQEFEDEDFYEDDEDLPELALTRTHSHSSPPPELVDDSDSEDDSPPQSPPQPTLDITLFDEKHNSMSESEQTAFFDDGYFIPERNVPMIAAC